MLKVLFSPACASNWAAPRWNSVARAWPGPRRAAGTIVPSAARAGVQCWRRTTWFARLTRTVVSGNLALHNGDEIAFFPPVTGG